MSNVVNHILVTLVRSLSERSVGGLVQSCTVHGLPVPALRPLDLQGRGP